MGPTSNVDGAGARSMWPTRGRRRIVRHAYFSLWPHLRRGKGGYGPAECCPRGPTDGFSAGLSYLFGPARGGAASGVGCRLRTRVWLLVLPDSCPTLRPGPGRSQPRGGSGRMRPKRRRRRDFRGLCHAIWTPPQSSQPMTRRALPGAWPRAACRPSVLASCDATWFISQH